MPYFVQPAFLVNSNIYEVNLRQYTTEGSIAAFSTHLTRLKAMGVEILWFMPIFPIGKKNRKGTLGSYYSIRDFKDVNPEFGTKEDFKTLMEKAHAMGFKIILDWVANHAAWDNVWTETNPDFFERDDQGNFKPPYDWEDVIQINHANPAEQLTMIDAMKYWVTNFDIDGFRADLAHLTPLPFWINARKELSQVKTDLVWLAETEEIVYHQAFDISFAWEWMHVTEDFCKGRKDMCALMHTLKRYKENFPPDALRMYFTSNHDENSWNGTEEEKYGEFAKVLAVFSHTWVGIPLIYSGQELPVTHRLQFFDKDAINWQQEPDLHQFYESLLLLRKQSPVIKAGNVSYPVIFNDAPSHNVLAFYRRVADDLLLVILNFNKGPVTLQFDAELFAGTYQNIFTGNQVKIEGAAELQLEAAGYFVGTKL